MDQLHHVTFSPLGSVCTQKSLRSDCNFLKIDPGAVYSQFNYVVKCILKIDTVYVILVAYTPQNLPKIIAGIESTSKAFRGQNWIREPHYHCLNHISQGGITSIQPPPVTFVIPNLAGTYTYGLNYFCHKMRKNNKNKQTSTVFRCDERPLLYTHWVYYTGVGEYFSIL